jgi:hypothetical protein
MAISHPHYCLLRELYLRGRLPQGGEILEVGEANWYSPDTSILCEDIGKYGGERTDDLLKQLSDAVAIKWQTLQQFAIAKVVYSFLVNPSGLDAIDMHGSDRAMSLDLNDSWLLRERDIVINHGTAEHVFDVAQVFRTMHHATKQGGLMIHDSPLTGWFDHGFYNFQPTLFFDVARANDYEIAMFAVYSLREAEVAIVRNREAITKMAQGGKVPANSLMFVAMTKTTGAPFKVPMQGYYSNELSDDGNQAWKTLR